MSGYTEIALLQYELAKLHTRVAELEQLHQQLAAKDEVIAEAGEMLAMRDRQLAALKAENETAWAQARSLAFQLQKTPLSSANGGILG